jgi:hypothetical protein
MRVSARELDAMQTGVEPSPLQQFVVRAGFGAPTLVQDDDPVCALDRGQAVGNDDCGPPRHQPLHGLQD